MRVINTRANLNQLLNDIRSKGSVIGFVPTMGALHKGHLSLIEASKASSDFTVASIFVNPTQFNNPSDLKNYPRNMEIDLKLLEQVGCDVVFAPSVDEMYPENDTRVFEFEGIDTVMEGEHRPGHFNGVAQIVSKLFDAVQPHKAFFGLKDYQQVAIIKQMAKNLKYNIAIEACSTIREKDGVAMSSRNLLLSDEHRKAAPHIYKTLQKSLELKHKFNLSSLKEFVISEINNEPLLKLEYFDVVDQLTLQSATQYESKNGLIACIAVWAGNVRLIDNIIYNY